jgi:ABC-type multidrug transport system fused ATPase/permease subunit
MPNSTAPQAPRAAYRSRDFIRFLLCGPFYWMMALLVVEAALAALTTWLIIKAGRDLSNQEFLAADFLWIVLAQSASYLVGAGSWVFAERAGFGAFGRYMLRFARDNRYQAALFADKHQRERVEPFLTNETFHIFFELVYELEADCKLFFSLLFNALVLGVAIDIGLPLVYGAVFVALLALQYAVRNYVAHAYQDNQQSTNRMTAHTYTAWDNIYSGNLYNFRLWHAGFKLRLRDALRAQIRAILAREGIAAVSGVVALTAVFVYLALVAASGVGNAGLLIALAATLPRQIEMSYSLHGLASGWNDLLATWTRIRGACNAMTPQPDAHFEARIHFEKIVLREHGFDTPDPPAALPCTTLDAALALLRARPRGRIHVRGGNGSGKSTLLAALKARLGREAFYWPTSDKLVFQFASASPVPEEAQLDEQEPPRKKRKRRVGFSSGERQLKSLQEICSHTHAQVYLLDEWDANLDAKNRAEAEGLVQQLAARALVVEISHRG